MPILKLRNHIPLSGPARREPADGTETDLRVSLGFEPAWFHRRLGVEFTERWHRDPYYRHDTLVQMKQELHRAFPVVSYWNPDDPTDTWTLSAVFGAYVIPQAFGCQLLYDVDRWPAIVERPDLSLEELARLDVGELMAAPLVKELDRQMDILEAEAGKIHGYLCWHGVLNNAFNIRGQAIFVDMVEDPDNVHRFFALITDYMIQLTQYVQARQRRSGFYINQLEVSNCVMNMISPGYYREFVMPYDRRIAESFERFGVHTCNWNIDPYAQDVSRLPKVGYIDMGISSNLPRAKSLFPEARRALMYSPVRLHDATLEEIEKDMAQVYGELAPCDLVMADIQADTPDTRVQALLEICRRLETSGPPGTGTSPRGGAA